MQPSEFWALTLPELNLLAEGHHQRERRAQEALLMGAWYGAALSRTKRLPPLARLLNPPQTRQLTPEQAAERKAEFQELSQRMLKMKRGTT